MQYISNKNNNPTYLIDIREKGKVFQMRNIKILMKCFDDMCLCINGLHFSILNFN